MGLESTAIKNLAPGANFGVIGRDLENLIWHSPNIEQPSADAIRQEMARLEAERPWEELRKKRSQLLAETDYLALSDVTLSTEMAEYRQALRDLPANCSDPANPVWPTKPGA